MRLQKTEVFKEYVCYKNFHKKMGRWQVCLVDTKDTSKRRTLLYSKYLMSIEVGRILTREEEVDHIDGDKSNDSIGNLEIVTRLGNEKRYLRNKPSRESVNLKCPNCGVIFEIDFRNSYLADYNNKKRNFCSRHCTGKFYRRLQLTSE